VVIIGVDPHKRTHTASAVEPGTNRVLATVQSDASLVASTLFVLGSIALAVCVRL